MADKAKMGSPEYKAKLSAARKKMWENPEYRAKRHASAVIAQNKPELQAARRERLKREWADGTRNKEKHQERMAAMWANPEYREEQLAVNVARFKEQAVKNWANPERRAKMTEKLQSRVRTPEALAANSKWMKELWADPEYRQAMLARRKDMYSAEWKAKVRTGLDTAFPEGRPIWNAGKTKETDPRLAAMSVRLAGTVPDYNKYRAWYRGPNGDIRMRSKWEVAYAQYLDRQGIAWKYEPKRFEVGSGEWNGITYIPDFYLLKSRTYIELKGRLSAWNKNKLTEFKRRYPRVKWKLLERDALIALGVLDIHGCAILE